LKLQLLLEDFDGIAKNVDKYADYNELLIVSELYMNGYIKSKDFTEDWKGNLSDYKIITEALNEVYDEKIIDKSREERKVARQQIKSINTYIDNPALIKIEEGLINYTDESFANDSTKVYMQLAKTESYLGNEQKSIEYIDKSINTVGDCTDDEYTTPMYEIVGIIADKDSPERLKDVVNYTEKVLTNTMTVKMDNSLRGENNSNISNDDTIYSNDDTQEKKSVSESFNDSFNTYVSQKRMAINITDIDTSGFETVKANLNISADISMSADEIKKILKVYDCDIAIEDYQLEKVTYSKANILLCIDVSGSMAGDPIQDLKEAVKLFVESTDKIESVAIVTFNNSIEDVWEFGTPNSDLIQATQSLIANGGTNMYDAAINSIDYFSSKDNELNCVILLSDGEDNNPATTTAIKENLGTLYKNKNTTLYALGFGYNVDSNYLNTLAGVTGGKYAYANSSNEIKEFFDSIRAQVLNSYVLTYKARDTFQNSRVLNVSIDDKSQVYDEQWYSLDGSEETNDDTSETVVYKNEGKSIYGFEQKLIFKSNQSYTLNFKGDGFTDKDKFVISLDGNIKYDHLAIKYIDSKTLEVIVPAGVATGLYDVIVSVNGKKAILTDGLMVAVQGSEKVTRFGDYVFTSYVKVSDGDVITLSSGVTMNNWLNFKGDVVIKGDLDGQSIIMTADKQAYVHYYKDTAEGLASVYAARGSDLTIPAIGDINLYNKYQFTTDEQMVETKSINNLVFVDFVRMMMPEISLYPDRLGIGVQEISLILPSQRKILKEAGLFELEVELEGSVGQKSIDIIAELAHKDKDAKKLADVSTNLGNLPATVMPSEMEFKIDTYKNETSLKIMLSLPYFEIADNDGAPQMGLSLGWKWGNKENPGIKLDEFMLLADFDIVLRGSPVQLTLSDFYIGVEDSFSGNTKLVGGCDISAYELKSLIPGIEKFISKDIAEMSVLTAEKTQLSLGLDKPYIGAETTMKFLSVMELGKVELEIGEFPYSNKLLGMEDKDVTGVRAKVTVGPSLHLSNIDLVLNGSVELALTNVFSGLTCNGEVSADVRLWILSSKFSQSGSALIGLEYSHNSDIVFVVKASGGSNIYYYQWSTKRGSDYDTTKL
ncbi:MAG: VWA domain-containing protein, partial [Clostridiales bacterium]|nr:VWA domain-containing protein [Clostridiales bacterium]